MSSPRLPKSCLTECLRQSVSASDTQGLDTRPSIALYSVESGSGVVANDVTASMKGVTWFEKRSGCCDVVSKLPFSPPMRPGNPIPKDEVFGTSEHQRYTREVVQYIRSKCEPKAAVFGFGMHEEESKVDTNTVSKA